MVKIIEIMIIKVFLKSKILSVEIVLSAHTHVCPRRSSGTRARARTHTRAHTHTHTHTHARTHARTHTRATHTHIHAHTSILTIHS